MLLDNYKKQSPIVGVAGLGGGINSYIFLSSGGDYVISKSLRFNSADTPKLTRTPSSASNRKTWTLSFWIKRTTTGSREQIISAAGSKNTYVEFQSDKLMIEDYEPGVNLRLWTTRVFRDPSAWYHIVVAMDTTQATSSNRVKLYVNGVQETVYDTATYPSQNYDTSFNNTGEHKIGQFPGNTNEPLNAYLADFHLVDGQQLAATNFGSTDDNGVWQPKKFSGAHGTNGFHLDFKDTDAIGNDASGSNNFAATNITAVVPGLATANQGMDVLTYTGNGNTRSISSLNFSPDLVWFKNRGTTNYHQLHDRVRGPLKRIYSNTNEGQNDYSTALTSFDSNGWTMGNGSPCNANGNTYVAWVWRAGGAASSNSNGSTTTQVSVNQTYGFSIATWTSPSGADTDGWTLGHGLSSAPKFMLVKNISGAGNWTVYHASLGNTKALYLNDTSLGQTNQSLWNNTDPTSTVWSAGSTGWYGTNNNFVTYAWSEIAGFSKFGTYSGGTNPKTITTGFKPKFLIFKRTDTANHWIMIDNVRGGIKKLAADTNNAENDNATIGDDSQNIVEFLVDGFKLTTTNAGTNVSGGTYVYAAWASKPDQSTLDVLIDSPSQNVADETDSGLGGEITSNYATYNPVRVGSGTKSNGNLTVTGTGQVPDVTSIAPNSGKWYAEIKWDSGSYARVGLQDVNIPTSDFGGVNGQSYRYESNSGNVQPGGQTYSTYAAGDIIGVAFDCDAGKLWLAKNGTWQNSGNPAAGSGAVATNLVSGSHYAPANSSGSGSSVFTLNAGQRAFAYTAPTGFKALCTANLPDPTIADGSKYFDTKLYTGNGGTQSITMDNSALSPDFVWIKCRNDAIEHQLFDTVRGALKSLRSDSSAVEATVANSLTAFDSNGFSLGAAQSVNHTKNYATWAWDAGANSNRTYAVTVVSSGGNKYRFDGNGDNAVTLNLAEGSTYIFDQSDNSNSGHPLRFSTTSNGSHGGGNEYTTGVTVTGTPGSAGAKTTIVIAASAPTLYYYCTAHSGMGGQINTNSTEGSTILSGGLNSSVYDQSQTWSSSVTSDNGFAGASYGATQAFNGTTSGNHTASNSNGTLTFAPNLTIPANSVIEGHFGSGSTAYMDVTVNGVANNSTAGGEFVKVNYNGSTTLTSLTITRTGGGNSADLRGLKINGVLLVDSGVTPPNVPSVTTILKANPEAGFSISRYPGAGAVSTIAHGLNTAPSMFIQKRITNSDSWHVYHIGAGNTKYARLENTDSFQVRTANWNNTSPTSSVVTLGDDGGVNGSGYDYLALCFAPISGYSAMGTYTGNGNADGIFIYTGFTPSWILFKRSDSTSDWSIYDTARDPHNVAGDKLEPNTTDTESAQGTVIDILSNGFKFRRNSLENGGNDVYIYMAFASHPFNSSRAR